MQAEDRLHYMDHLRALAMLAGVVFHAALAYSPLMHPIWPTADTGRSIVVDGAAWFLHLFRMPLFFVVTGFFAAWLVARRGLGGLFRNRCARVLLPLLLFLPLVTASMYGLTQHAAASVVHPSPALAWLRTYIDQHGTMPFVPGWAHLWFLFYLMLFTVLVWVASTLELRRIGDSLASLPATLLPALLPVWLALPLVWAGVPWPAPDALLPSLWALVFFGAYFALGYGMYRRADLLDRLRPLSSWLLCGAVVAYALLFWSSRGFTAAVRPSSWGHALLQAYAGCWMTLWCVLAARRWLDGRNRTLRWLADASYWVYLVHLPVLFAIQYGLLDVRLHWSAKFALATVSTLAVSFASYQALVRHTVIGRLLGGKLTAMARRPATAGSV